MTRSAQPADPAALLDAALARRAGLVSDPQTDVCRLFHSGADGIDGLVIEKLGSVLVVQLHAGRLAIDDAAVRELCAAAAARVQATAVYRKVFPKDRTTPPGDLERQHRDPTPWIGTLAEAELAVRENGAMFVVRPYDGYATGLFLDHRAARARVRELATGRRVLNAFAYTCGFTVAAALGGAAATVSVDISRKALEWGKRNLVANGLALDVHRFICADVLDYYRRAARQGQRFDFVILDPPTFARVKETGRVFSLAADLPRLVAGALELLDADGILHLSVNHRGTSLRALQAVVRGAARAQGRRAALLEGPPPPEDFPGDPDFAKSVWLRLGGS
jgi:23S rRNA (cytosine1962-C5)-methyltransferase